MRWRHRRAEVPTPPKMSPRESRREEDKCQAEGGWEWKRDDARNQKSNAQGTLRHWMNPWGNKARKSAMSPRSASACRDSNNQQTAQHSCMLHEVLTWTLVSCDFFTRTHFLTPRLAFRASAGKCHPLAQFKSVVPTQARKVQSLVRFSRHSVFLPIGQSMGGRPLMREARLRPSLPTRWRRDAIKLNMASLCKRQSAMIRFPSSCTTSRAISMPQPSRASPLSTLRYPVTSVIQAFSQAHTLKSRLVRPARLGTLHDLRIY